MIGIFFPRLLILLINVKHDPFKMDKTCFSLVFIFIFLQGFALSLYFLALLHTWSSLTPALDIESLWIKSLLQHYCLYFAFTTIPRCCCAHTCVWMGRLLRVSADWESGATCWWVVEENHSDYLLSQLNIRFSLLVVTQCYSFSCDN